MIRINVRTLLAAAAFSCAGLVLGVSYVAIHYSTPGESGSVARKANAGTPRSGAPAPVAAAPADAAPQTEIPAGM